MIVQDGDRAEEQIEDDFELIRPFLRKTPYVVVQLINVMYDENDNESVDMKIRFGGGLDRRAAIRLSLVVQHDAETQGAQHGSP